MSNTNDAGWERSGTVRLAAGDIYYEAGGAGRPVVLLHGGMASLREWDVLRPLLSGSFPWVAYDRAGVGRSGGAAFQPDIVANGAAELDCVFERLGIERAGLIGSCLGGAIALRFAGQFPERVQAVITTGVLFHGSGQLRQRLSSVLRPWSRMPRQFHDAVRRVYGEDNAESSYERFRRMYGHGESVGYASSPDYDLRAELARIACPVLTVHGDRDPFWGVEQPASAYPLLLQGALWVLPDCAHYPHVEYPRVFGDQAARFFAAAGL